MVIHHFNRLIRNKWVWGAFAVAISAFFALDFLFTGNSSGDEGSANAAGSLNGDDVNWQEFDMLRAAKRREMGRMGQDIDSAELNRSVWGEIAAYRTARALSLEASDEELKEIIKNERAFQTDGAFDFKKYQDLVARAFELTPEGYEERLRRGLSVDRLGKVVAADASWVPPAMLDLALRDMTDNLTIRLVTYTNTTDSMVETTEEDLRAYYDSHTNSLALPDCATVRFVRIAADTPERLAKFEVSDDDVEQYYEDNITQYETTTAEGTTTKPVEEVKDEIVKAVQLEKSLAAYEEDFSVRCQNAIGADTKLLEEIAKESGAEIQTSPVFALDGTVHAHFTQRATAFAPGAQGFADAAAEVDATNRWNFVLAPKAVYVMEYDTVIPAHTPTYEEAIAKDALKADALREKKAKVFKESVEAAVAPAAAALKEGKSFEEVESLFGAAGVSTQLVFCASKMMPQPFPEARDIYRQASELAAGELSEVIPLPGSRKGYVVYMQARENNNAEAMTSLAPVRSQFGDMAGSVAVDAWTDWNLKRMNLATRPNSSIEKVEDESGEEEE